MAAADVALRVTVFHFNPGHERDQDFYLDVGRYTPGETVWHAEDHYLDLVVVPAPGSSWPISTSCSRRSATACSAPKPANKQFRRAVSTIEGLSRHDYDLDRWLAGHGVVLTWRGA